ncbi:hypothetical protein [Aureimonas sp. Leaf324]|jgi:hypothetical protein|uniref:hypothetical protein n=1 Tax=Aureimonas sp. Leaf324 TaxID=1736336 RepID=UPI0012E2D50B|nr:hypothetical protein [Aureimonas sp. Leaf324]
MAPIETAYRSSNGDDWLVERAPTGEVVAVIHRANPASGGTETKSSIEDFLARGGGSPEAMAVRKLVEHAAD